MNLSQKRCIPCEVGGVPLTPEEAQVFLRDIKGWEVDKESKKISKNFSFKNFVEAMDFVNKVADISESEGHHPDIKISWNKVSLELTTHAIKGLSENDFILAAKIDMIV